MPEKVYIINKLEVAMMLVMKLEKEFLPQYIKCPLTLSRPLFSTANFPSLQKSLWKTKIVFCNMFPALETRGSAKYVPPMKFIKENKQKLSSFLQYFFRNCCTFLGRMFVICCLCWWWCCYFNSFLSWLTAIKFYPLFYSFSLNWYSGVNQIF